MDYNRKISQILPVTHSPLIHCLTNGISRELLANGILFIGGRPMMTEYLSELPASIEESDAILLNIGHLSAEREESLRSATRLAMQWGKPCVLDCVGIASLENRLNLVKELRSYPIAVVKGNISEMRRLVGLPSKGRGVDNATLDQKEEEMTELASAFADLSVESPGTAFLATGKVDLVAYQGAVYCLENGVDALDHFTGSGDLLGAIIATALSSGVSALDATIASVSFFNICAERARRPQEGMATFRHALLDKLSLSHPGEWERFINMKKLEIERK